MKYACTYCLFLLCIFNSFSQENNYKEVSYTEFFKLIEAHEDSIVELKNVLIKYDAASDENLTRSGYAEGRIKSVLRTDSLIVTKELNLINVHFLWPEERNVGPIKNIIFTKDVTTKNSHFGGFYQCDFLESLNVGFDENYNDIVKEFERLYQTRFFARNLSYDFCNFYGGINYYSSSDEYIDVQFGIIFSKIWPLNKLRHSTFSYENQYNFWLTSNEFIGDGIVFIAPDKGEIIDIDRNTFNSQTVRLLLGQSEINRINLSKNYFSKPVFLRINNLRSSHNVSWNQFSNKIIDSERFGHYFFMLDAFGLDSIPGVTFHEDFYGTRNIEQYIERVRIENAEVNHSEKKIRSVFYNHYKENQNTEFGNAVYIEMKDLETERLQYLHKSELGFDTFFTLKINQFLKVFSAYGTKPSKAIIFSLYVIFAFALIYLFFPNTWDVHGKNRLIHRYTFFMKYMNRKAGINEVYLEDKKPELMSYNSFKKLIENSEEKAPYFFKATALPLYRWAISGTYITARLLSKVDIMKGKWTHVPKKKRFWKSILLVGAFLVAIIYDLLIKILNALMLSINTFTTLGFGEIPIKGLPRYLAIIQGFIGWFMLTIFSVSLISQLLN